MKEIAAVDLERLPWNVVLDDGGDSCSAVRALRRAEQITAHDRAWELGRRVDVLLDRGRCAQPLGRVTPDESGLGHVGTERGLLVAQIAFQLDELGGAP